MKPVLDTHPADFFIEESQPTVSTIDALRAENERLRCVIEMVGEALCGCAACEAENRDAKGILLAALTPGGELK